MDAMRRTALVAGLFYLITFAASIPAVFLLAPVLDNANYIVSAGAEVALFPVVKRQNEATALGFVTSRMLAAAIVLSATTALFRGNDPITPLAAIATVPIFLWELSLGVWLVVKGFKPSPITIGMAEPNVAA